MHMNHSKYHQYMLELGVSSEECCSVCLDTFASPEMAGV